MTTDSLSSRLQVFQQLPIIFSPFWLVAFNTAVVTLISIPNDLHHWLELLSHFRLQNCASAFLCVIIFASYRLFKTSAFMLVIAAVNLFYIYPWYLADETASLEKELAAEKQTLRIIHSNVHTANRDFDEFVSFVTQAQPDILVVQEINQRWGEELSELRTQMPFGEVITREDNFGIGIFSKVPLAGVDQIKLGSANVPSLQASFTWSDSEVELLTTHPLPPITSEYYQLRNEQIEAVAKWSSERQVNSPSVNRIVIGDFNTTMWSENYRPLAESSSLRNAAKGFGIFPTWPASLPLLMLPIDHCFVSNKIRVENYQLGEDIGSDHLPIVVDLAF